MDASSRGFSNESAALLEAGVVGHVSALKATDDPSGGRSNGNGSGKATTSVRTTAISGAGVAGREGEVGGADGEGGGGGDAGEWEEGRRRSPICETAQILAALVKQRVKTLAFCRTRKLTELTLRYGHEV